MQLYPLQTSFTAGQDWVLAVQPRRRFSVAIYQQQAADSMVWVGGVTMIETSDVEVGLKNDRCVFESTRKRGAVRHDTDWGWPTITVGSDAGQLESGAYAAVAYEVDRHGEPLTALGRRCVARQPVYAAPPDSDSMALVIVRPRAPSAAIAYIVPVATYHAYNSLGGGCFYGDPVHRTHPQTTVTLRRPGGGLGAQLGYSADAYDRRSPRQHFTHWDAKFIRWLRFQNIACDFYTDVDLHRGTDLDLSHYRCALSVGHHEYWSQQMRDHVSRFIAGGGNLAVFSGNTCYRPVDFGTPHDVQNIAVMNRLAESWPGYSESDLLGLSFGYGGGSYGVWSRFRRKWIETGREPIGFTVRRADHWVYAGVHVRNGQTFGADDRLVGYEADGVPHAPNGAVVLADSERLAGWDIGGAAAMALYCPDVGGGANRGHVFNCGTTDWSRVLVDLNASSYAIVGQITLNVLRRFTGAAEDASPAQAVFAESP